MASFNCAIASDTAYLIGNRNAIILSHAVTCIVSLPVLRGAKKNGGDKRDVTRERRGTMVWHIALSSPRRRSDLTADLRIADLPSYTYLRLCSMSSFLRRTYHRAEFNEATISPNEKYERFHKAPRRSQVLRSAMVLDRCYNHRSVSKPRWKHYGSFRSTWVFFLASSDALAALICRYPHVLILVSV